MSSILTNTAATTALQTLKAINAEMSDLRAALGTGQQVANPSEGASVWAISKTMEADVAGFKRVSESLALGQSTLSVARQGAETITELLTEIKGKVVAAQEENVDRTKIQANIASLRDQVDAIVGMAQFNGQNLLSNRDTAAGSGQVAILASFNRSGADVTTSDLLVRRRDLSTAAGVVAGSGGTYAAGAVSATLDATQSRTLDLSGLSVAAGAAFSLSVFGTDGDGSSFAQADYRTSAAASQTQGEMAASALSYVARDGDTMGDVAGALARKWETYAAANGLDADVLSVEASGASLVASSTVTDATDSIAVAVDTLSADAGSTIGGGLDELGTLDVTTDSGADAAMATIEGLLDVSIGTAAAIGSDQGRIETQRDFVGDITATLKSGIGQMVDAKLDDISARMQALQVQQQLAVQALSIANQAPQVILTLFR